MPLLEEVFRLSGIPTYTFVQPERYDETKVSVRTPGRCMVVEGPSGIGKTTTISKAISELGIQGQVLNLSARRPDDTALISELPNMDSIGIVVVDDFHRLSSEIKAQLSDYMKLLADAEDENSKLILVGINKAGQQLVKFAHDLGLRMDIFRLETNSDQKIIDLINLGEEVLNIKIPIANEVAARSQGSFQIAQLLCHKLCVLSGVTESQKKLTTISLPLDVVIEDVMADLSRQFKEAAVAFARGSKLRKEGRAPYLHILKWLAESDEWSLDVAQALNANPEQRGSVTQVLEKGYLHDLLTGPDKGELLSQHFHYEPATRVLSVDDPKLIFYLKNLIWRAFTRQVGYNTDYFPRKYDFALSFAGSDRIFAEKLYEILSEREVQVFYDRNEQHRIISQNIEQYLGPIYRSEAAYVIPLLSIDYPTRIWTKFESDNFKDRFGEGAVIPVRFTNVAHGFFSDDQKYGGLQFDPTKDAEQQLHAIAETLCRRLVTDRSESTQESDQLELPSV